MKPVVNPANLERTSREHGIKFAVQTAEVGQALGLGGLGCMLHIVPPGKMSGPFHRHHGCDEMFVILSGSGEYRFGDEHLPFKAGDCLGAPAGGAAHQIVNTGSEELRYLGLSNNGPADTVEFPDSGKISVRVGATGVHYENATIAVRGRITPADYWDGE